MIWVIAGTEKGRALTERLNESGYHVVVTTSTSYGSSLIDGRKNVLIRHGELDSAGMEGLVEELGVRLIIDASHPFSEGVKRNLLGVTEKTGTPLLELGRAPVSIPGAVLFDTFQDAADYLKGKDGNVLLTIGSRNLKYFHESGTGKMYARVLPVENSMAACAEAGFTPDRILAMKHPFSREFEKALMKELGIRYLVTKESGAEGGVLEKTGAALESGLEVIVIKRPASLSENVYFDIEQIVKKAGEILNG